MPETPIDKSENVLPPTRGMSLRKEDYDKHGYTPGCIGCITLQDGGTSRVGHRQECRTRMLESIAKDETGEERLRLQKEKEDQRMTMMFEEVLEIEENKKRKVEGTAEVPLHYSGVEPERDPGFVLLGDDEPVSKLLEEREDKPTGSVQIYLDRDQDGDTMMDDVEGGGGSSGNGHNRETDDAYAIGRFIPQPKEAE